MDCSTTYPAKETDVLVFVQRQSPAYQARGGIPAASGGAQGWEHFFAEQLNTAHRIVVVI